MTPAVISGEIPLLAIIPDTIATLPSPGASAKGRFVTRAMATVVTIISKIMDVSITPLSSPAFAMILGTVPSTYAMVTNVVIPARISVLTVVPCSARWNCLSIQVLEAPLLAVPSVSFDMINPPLDFLRCSYYGCVLCPSTFNGTILQAFTSISPLSVSFRAGLAGSVSVQNDIMGL